MDTEQIAEITQSKDGREVKKPKNSKKYSRKNYKKGYKRTILNFLHICGVISYDSLSFLPNREMYIRAITTMKKDGLVETVRTGKHGPWQVYLKSYSCTCEEYIGYLPREYRNYYEKVIIKDKYFAKSRPLDTYGIKVLKTSDTLIFMYSCKISILLEEKPKISEKYSLIPKNQSFFYTSREIKNCYGYEATTDTTKYGSTIVHNSRLIGCLVSNGNAYAVYHTGNTLLKWSYSGEFQMARYLSSIFRKKYDGYKDTNQQLEAAIIFAKDTSCFLRILQADPFSNSYNKHLINIENSAYRKMYALPLNKDGQQLLEIMKRTSWQEEMKHNLLSWESIENAKNQIAVPCDGYENDTYCLLFCIPDMVRLKSFLIQAKKQENKSRFSIYCFSFQNEFIIELAQNWCNIYNIELNDYYQEILDT